ncbi:hypothetical protein [Methanobrevibacter millerae]|uniref:Uncharacterized protein n=1 Tax=Methanobrevibacter millerae TaxID=230361 RepID=A0A1G5VXN4_9EURY|nr:hypothetical protein [Methanobrevibacter millerae]SDA50186.1 hypothetical protein SAMN02910315_00942 [Methanobrevibacter millerae]
MIITILAVIFFFLIVSACCCGGGETILNKADSSSKRTASTNKTFHYRESESKGKSNDGGYCGLSCIHYREEFLDSGGAIVSDYCDGGNVEYYCDLGHSPSPGRFCKDYE